MAQEMRAPGCEEARRLLWPPDMPRRHTPREEAARRHVAECAECSNFFRRDAEVARWVRTRGLAARAPGELRERVYDALAQERALRSTGAGRRPRRRGGILAAAAILLLSLGAGGVWLARGGGGVADVYVRDFVSRAVEEDAVRTSDPAMVTRFFTREMGRRIAPVSLEDARLSRAMICLIRGDRAAMVEYEWRGHTVAHYRLPLSGRPALARSGRPRWSEERGIHVVRWEEGGFEHALVSELPGEELVRLARERFLAPER